MYIFCWWASFVAGGAVFFYFCLREVIVFSGWKSRSHKEEDESSASDSGDSLPPLEFIKDGTRQKVEEIGPGAWLKEMG